MKALISTDAGVPADADHRSSHIQLKTLKCATKIEILKH